MPFSLDDHSREAIRRHFKRKQLVWNESYFLQVLEKPYSKHDVYWAVIALRDCGTFEAIEALKDKLSYPMQDVKCCSILTIAHIAKEAETPLYAAMLMSPEYKDKGYAMWAIRAAADSRAIESVLAYFKKNRAKLKGGKLTNGTLADGLEYLQRYLGESKPVETFFADVKEFFNNLAQGEQVEIVKRVSYFSTFVSDSQRNVPGGVR